jgi:phage terminase Nu1 subunit (DNA packaging protein)
MSLDTMPEEIDTRRFPLPEGVTDAVVNKAQLAAAFSTSETTIDKWMRRKGFPVVAGGSNGVAYQFRLSEVWAWREAQKAQDAAHQRAVETAVHQLRMVLRNVEDDDSDLALSPRERRDEYEAEARYLATARQRRELVPTAEVLALLETLFGMIRDGLDAHPDRVARELGLDGGAVEKLVALNDDLINQLRRQIETACLGERPDRLL